MTMTHFSGKGEIKASRVGSENKRTRNRFHSVHLCMYTFVGLGKGREFRFGHGNQTEKRRRGCRKKKRGEGGGDRVSDGRADPD